MKRQRFGANTVRSGKGRIALDSRIDFRRTWSFTFYTNHSIIAHGWTLSEQMAINLTGLIPFRHLSCVSRSPAQAVFNLDWHDCTQGLLSLILPFFLSLALTCSIGYWITFHQQHITAQTYLSFIYSPLSSVIPLDSEQKYQKCYSSCNLLWHNSEWIRIFKKKRKCRVGHNCLLTKRSLKQLAKPTPP